MAKAKLSSLTKTIISIAAVLIALIITCSIYCVVTDQTPSEAVHSVFSSSEDRLIGKWQSQTSPGLSAYVFKDDGTYDSYLSTVNFSGNYTTKGSKLYLKNPDTSKEIVYKYKVSGKVLTLTLLEQDGREATEEEVLKYDLVTELHQKSLSDLIGELQSEKSEEASEDTND